MASELIHTCYRITDVDRSVDFYEKLGFEELRRMPIRDEAINVFMGLPGDGARLELTYNHDQDGPYEIGTGYGHIAITAEDLDGTLERLARDRDRAGEAALHRPRGGLPSLLRPRPGRLSNRANRTRSQLALEGRARRSRREIHATPRRPRVIP